MLNKIVFLSLLMCAAVPAGAQVSIRINVMLYPELVPVPGYPVYYAPQVDSNYFFYDGMYWVYQDDDWYASSWYNGPWELVDPEVVPLFVLRVPVRYYRQPPMYFRGWQSDAPPRWGEHWGNHWEEHRSGWDRWNHNMHYARPPLPEYQRQYSGDRYPRIDEQQELRNKNYHYQPRDPAVRQHVQAQRTVPTPDQRRPQEVQSTPAPLQHRGQEMPQERNFGKRDVEHSASPQSMPNVPPVQRERQVIQKPMPTDTAPQRREPPVQEQKQQQQPHQQPLPQQGTVQRQQPMPKTQSPEARPQHEEAPQEPRQGHGQDHERNDDHGQDHQR